MQTVVYLTVLFGVLYFVDVAGAADLDYRRQDEWEGQCNTGPFQSPIAIEKASLSQDPLLQPLYFNNLGQKRSIVVTNIGFQVQYALPDGNPPPTVGGGKLNGLYILENFHFHWPSEHTIDGQHFDLEGHFVFYSAKYPNFPAAFGDPNGLAVVGVFYKVGYKSGSIALHLLADATRKVSETQGSNTTAHWIVLRDLIPYDVNNPFFTYHGSLTTPDCNEIVNWYLFEYPLLIKQKQFDKLKTIYDSSGDLLTLNNRDIYPLNGRNVSYKPAINT